MGKTRRGERELSKEQRLIKENQQLKRENSKLRKDLARIDLDRYNTVREMVQEYRDDKKLEKTSDLLDSLKKQWACRQCKDGHLEIFTYSKVGATWYYRICSNAPQCKNRTTSKKYDPAAVRGIIKNEQ